MHVTAEKPEQPILAEEILRDVRLPGLSLEERVEIWKELRPKLVEGVETISFCSETIGGAARIEHQLGQLAVRTGTPVQQGEQIFVPVVRPPSWLERLVGRAPMAGRYGWEGRLRALVEERPGCCCKCIASALVSAATNVRPRLQTLIEEGRLQCALQSCIGCRKRRIVYLGISSDLAIEPGTWTERVANEAFAQGRAEGMAQVKADYQRLVAKARELLLACAQASGTALSPHEIAAIERASGEEIERLCDRFTPSRG